MRRFEIKQCVWCGSPLEPDRKHPERQLRNRFCNRRCYGQWRRTIKGYKATVTNEERDQRSQRMKKLRERPDVQKKLTAHCTSAENLAVLSQHQRKGIETQRATGFANLISAGEKGRQTQRSLGFPWLKTHAGGNGRGPTVPQKILLDALPGAVLEYPIRTEQRHPPALKVDLAITLLRLAIEVDGPSHKVARAKQADARKEQILKERGWTLLRFWNEEILCNLPAVLTQIQTTISALEKQQPNLVESVLKGLRKNQ